MSAGAEPPNAEFAVFAGKKGEAESTSPQAVSTLPVVTPHVAGEMPAASGPIPPHPRPTSSVDVGPDCSSGGKSGRTVQDCDGHRCDDENLTTLSSAELNPRSSLPTPSAHPSRPGGGGRSGGAKLIGGAGRGGGGDISTTMTPEPRPALRDATNTNTAPRNALTEGNPRRIRAMAGAVAVRGREHVAGEINTAIGQPPDAAADCFATPGALPKPHADGVAPSMAPAMVSDDSARGIRSPPERIVTPSDRISRLAVRLAEMGLAPPRHRQQKHVAGSGVTHATPDTDSADNAEPSSLFFHALRSMSSVVSRTSNAEQRSRKGRALDALLLMLERVVDEAAHRGSEAEYWSEREGAAGRRLRDVLMEFRAVRERLEKVEREAEDLRRAASGSRGDGMESIGSSAAMSRIESRSVQLRCVSTMTEADALTAGEASEQEECKKDEIRAAKDENKKLETAVITLSQQQDAPNSISLDTSSINAASTLMSAEHEMRHQHLRDQIAHLEAENGALRHNLTDVDAARQELEAHLLVLTSQCGGSMSQQPSASTVSAGNTHNEELHRALAARENEVVHLREAMRQAQMESERLGQAVRARDEELDRARTDLAALTREGRAVATESARLGAEVAATRKSLEDQTRRADGEDQRRRAAELERTDLLRNYRAVCDEKSHLERAVEELSGERARLSHELALREEESRRLHGQAQDWEREVARRTSDASDFERQLDKVSRDSMAVRRTLEAAEVENRRLREDLRAARRSAEMAAAQAAAQAAELQRAAAAASHDAEAARVTVEAMEEEGEAVRRMLAEERLRSEGLEGLVSAARVRDAAAAEQMRRMARENAQLSTKLNEASARLGGERDSIKGKSGKAMEVMSPLNQIGNADNCSKDVSLTEGTSPALMRDKGSPLRTNTPDLLTAQSSHPCLNDYLGKAG